MPSPIGHSLMAYSIHRLNTRPAPVPWLRLFFYLIAANAPDLDFLPGMLMGKPNQYHHGVSHSIGFSVLFGAAVSLFLYLGKRTPTVRNFFLSSSLYFSHIALDYFSIDTSVPYGQPIFWPVSQSYYISPFAFFPDIRRTGATGSQFIPSLFSFHNLWALTVESLLFVVLIVALEACRKGAGQPVAKGID